MGNHKLIDEAKMVLVDTSKVLDQLNSEEYTKKIPYLGDSSIGQHSRHVIELFQQLLEGYNKQEVNYDKRKRNAKIEQNIDFAKASIVNIISLLDKPNKTILLRGVAIGEDTSIQSSYYREILYNIEHCVHHQALIKVGLLHLNKTMNNNEFGVAKSTKIYRKTCAQ